jgi:hypothetical protein
MKMLVGLFMETFFAALISLTFILSVERFFVVLGVKKVLPNWISFLIIWILYSIISKLTSLEFVTALSFCSVAAGFVLLIASYIINRKKMKDTPKQVDAL